jgi:hypothetical protein
MPKKCPPGVICVENMSLVIILSICGIIFYLVYMRMHPTGYTSLSNQNNSTTMSSGISNSIMMNTRSQSTDPVSSHYEMLMKPGHGYTNNPQDVLLNPYTPPVNMANMPQSSTPISHPYVPPGHIPVNVSTNIGQRQTNYTQVGILTPSGGNDKILALMGRQLHTSRQKWQYYTISDNNNSVKLPVIKNGRSCTNEYGCDELSNGDTVYVEGYGQAFKITIYENDTLQYIPYL